jgi:creatinine amidohydrolase/Fe(II)-dependent formamide hydrolase-like protein
LPTLAPRSQNCLPDTSELMYLGGDDYVRKDRLVAGSPDNGVVGDPRQSSPDLGKRVFDMKVDYGALIS